MKKRLCICAVSLTFLISCQKKYCWKCTTITYTRTAPSSSVFTGYTNDTTRNDFELCDETETQIKGIEKATSSDRIPGNLIILTVTNTNCNQ